MDKGWERDILRVEHINIMERGQKRDL